MNLHVKVPEASTGTESLKNLAKDKQTVIK